MRKCAFFPPAIQTPRFGDTPTALYQVLLVTPVCTLTHKTHAKAHTLLCVQTPLDVLPLG